ncbi:MAG: DUF4139 domain-containing protein [Bacteroidetes bacterium]|nr:DUF4139 domain-containing protein [Bacteroidota bacterium]
MKNWLFLFLTVCIFKVEAQSDKRIASKLESVTIFEQGARFERNASLKLSPGNHRLVFYGLPITINPSSIQIGSDRKLDLLSIQTSNSGSENPLKQEEIGKLEAQIAKLNLTRENTEAQIEALRLENEFLTKNTQLGGTSGYSLSELQQISQYARSQKLKNQLEQQKLHRELRETSSAISKTQTELSKIKQLSSKLSGEIIVKLNNPTDQNCKFNIVYSIANNASWSNAYNLYFKQLTEGLALSHKASIYQSTGEDWNNVALRLVTGNPRQNISMPRESPAYVNFIYRNQVQASSDAPRMHRDVETASVQAQGKANEKDRYFNNLNSKSFQVNNQQNRIEFLAPKRYTIKSDESESIILRDIALDAKYEYQASPRLDPAAYLIATVNDWEKHQLLPGELSIYNQGLFIGSTYLNPQVTSDSLMFSLGQDPSIKIAHNRIFSKESKSFLGSDRIDEYSYEISLNNLKTNSLKIRVFDRIPVSQNEDIKIKYVLNDEAKLSQANNGIIEWEIELQAKKERKISFSYEIRYPKDQSINW